MENRSRWTGDNFSLWAYRIVPWTRPAPYSTAQHNIGKRAACLLYLFNVMVHYTSMLPVIVSMNNTSILWPLFSLSRTSIFSNSPIAHRRVAFSSSFAASYSFFLAGHIPRSTIPEKSTVSLGFFGSTCGLNTCWLAVTGGGHLMTMFIRQALSP